MVNMGVNSRMRGIIFTVVVFLVGVIHLGVGIGITAKYHSYSDIFDQEVALAGYNIFIGLCTMAIATVGLVSIINQNPFLGRITAFAAFFLGVITFISLIVALALSGGAARHLHDNLVDNVNGYAEDDDSIDTVNKIQTKFQCCGVNTWLDWSRVSLGSSSGIGNGRRRRRRYSPLQVSPLTQALRKKRQSSDGSTFDLPSGYDVELPLSCCKSGSTNSGDSLGGTCEFTGGDDTSAFYVQGCLVPVANVAFSQITSIAVINTCLAILAFVYFAKLLKYFRNNAGLNNANAKQDNQYTTYQEQPQYQQQYQPQYQQQFQQQFPQQQQQFQNSYDPYYTNTDNSAPYYIYNDPTYKTYL